MRPKKPQRPKQKPVPPPEKGRVGRPGTRDPKNGDDELPSETAKTDPFIRRP
jgi:hypothetical protein